MPENKEFLTVKEFCKYFDFEKHAIYRYIRDKKIFAIKIGTKYFIPISKLYDLEYKG